MTEIQVYTKPSCVQCNATYRALDSKNADYAVFDLASDPAALEKVKNLGYLQAPVVIVTQDGEVVDHWSGFRPDRIKDVVSRAA